MRKASWRRRSSRLCKLIVPLGKRLLKPSESQEYYEASVRAIEKFQQSQKETRAADLEATP
jgi:hypothetical protein